MTESASPTTPTSPSLSTAGSPSLSPPADQGGASSTTITRPDYVPETFWDPATNQVKAQEFTAHIGELAALKAQHEARLAARPAEPTGYELKFADDFKPEIAIKFDETDPRLAPLRAFAHAQNLDQAGFSQLLQIEAGRVIAENKAMEAAAAAEVQKLGANGPARVTAAKTWLTGILGAPGAQQMIDRHVLASDIELLEKLQLAFTSQGGSTYNNGGRETPPPPQVPLEKKLWPKRQNAG